VADSVEQVNALVLEDIQITVTHIADTVDINCRSVSFIIQEDFRHHRSVPSASRVTLMLFWGFIGSILEYYQDYAQTFGSAQYCTMLEEELKPAIHSKQRGMLTHRVVLNHDNTLTSYGSSNY
jgi:hypothetical protein